ncbi:MAG TPA: peptide MFS transporter [Candidatus Limnocylindrales bacterium]|nr:peptide MFS transporter [Candidatus Limnocylindrales bacterium]
MSLLHRTGRTRLRRRVQIRFTAPTQARAVRRRGAGCYRRSALEASLDHVPPAAARTFLGHPAGLFVLFFTEMWERMSYYGMRALLVLYMTSYLFADDARAHNVLGYDAIRSTIEGVFGGQNTQQLASQLYGLYTGLVYLTPFFGGMLADRVLGQRKSVYIGGVLMMIGHFLMAVESLFFVALFFLICGNGCFKPNISTQVGRLYGEGDPRRDAAFTIFYMGINLGAFFAPLVCGTLGQSERFGWHWGFASAGVGMALGLVVYFLGQSTLAPDTLNAEDERAGVRPPLTAAEKYAILSLCVLCVLNIVFWGVYEQQGNTMQLWADARTDWHVFGRELPSTWYQAFNPLMIFVFAPVLSAVWAWQARRAGGEPSSVVKMAIGCALLGVGYIVMIAAATVVPSPGRGSISWLVGATFIFTIGELYLSPIGLSLVTKVAPRRYVSMLMGMWFLSSFFGNYMSGLLGTFYSVLPGNQFFAMLAVLAIATGATMWAMNRPLQRWLGGHM